MKGETRVSNTVLLYIQLIIWLMPSRERGWSDRGGCIPALNREKAAVLQLITGDILQDM